MDFQDIQIRFSNLEALWVPGALKVKLFEDGVRSKAFSQLSTLQKTLASESDLFEPLRIFLSHLHWELRGFVGEPQVASQHWNTQISKLNEHLAPVHHFLDMQKKDNAIALRSSMEVLAKTDVEYLKAILSSLGSGKQVLVVEKRRQKEILQSLVNSLDTLKDSLVVSLDVLFRLQDLSERSVFILAAPRRISENHMRALVMGGSLSSATFICANWLAGSTPGKISQDLIPGLTSIRSPELTVMGHATSSTSTYISDDVFTEHVSANHNSSFEKYSATGPIECRLIEIAGGFVMPVELSANRVSVLAEDEHGRLAVHYRIPGKTLEPGDILFELRDGAEEDFLMELAQIKMGSKFNEFARGRELWKSRAKQAMLEKGYKATVSFLHERGVSTADNLSVWLDNQDFTTPRANKDWHNLLMSLEFSPGQVKEMEALGSELRATLISIGQSARLQMADAVTFQDLELIRSKEIVTKQLDEFGEAVFVLGMVEKVDNEKRLCNQNEIRKVLRK